MKYSNRNNNDFRTVSLRGINRLYQAVLGKRSNEGFHKVKMETPGKIETLLRSSETPLKHSETPCGSLSDL